MGDTYARFMKPKGAPKVHGEFIGTALPEGDFRPGQYDGGVVGYGSHDPKDGWFKVKNWSMFAQRSKDFSTEAKAGKINKQIFRLIKYFGRLSPLTMKALSSSYYFDFELETVERFGDVSKVVNGYYLENAVLYHAQYYVGSGKSGSSLSTLSIRGEDTKELEAIYLVAETVRTGFKKHGFTQRMA